MRKTKQCRSTDRQTRDKSSQDANHSGLISVSVESPSSQAHGDTDQHVSQEPGKRKPVVLWPDANKKEAWNQLEEKIEEKIRETWEKADEGEGDAKKMIEVFSTIIYETSVKEFGLKGGKDKNEKVEKSGPSRRQRQLAKLRTQKRKLKKQFKSAPQHEQEGLKALYCEIKRKSRDVRRQERRYTRRREGKRVRERFIKDPYGEAKKLFTEPRSGKLNCSKEELDLHVKQTYSDPLRNQPLPELESLKRPASPNVSFNVGPIEKWEVDQSMKKARAKSSPGGDDVSY